MNSTYITVKLIRTLGISDMERVALELAALNPELFAQICSSLGLNAVAHESLKEKVQKMSKQYYAGTAGEKIARIKAHREICKSSLLEAKEWVESNFPKEI